MKAVWAKRRKAEAKAYEPKLWSLEPGFDPGLPRPMPDDPCVPKSHLDEALQNIEELEAELQTRDDELIGELTRRIEEADSVPARGLMVPWTQMHAILRALEELKRLKSAKNL